MASSLGEYVLFSVVPAVIISLIMVVALRRTGEE